MAAGPAVTLARVRLLVLRGLPLTALDVPSPDDAPGGRDLVAEVVERGFERLTGVFGVDLPRRARVGLTLRDGALVLEDEMETGLLRIREDGLDEAWLIAARRLRGTMMYVGTDLEITPGVTPRDVGASLEEAAADGRVAGSIVGFAEASDGQGLPFFP